MKPVLPTLENQQALFTIQPLFAQDQENLEKYWQYRDRYRQQFTKIGALPGESLPLKSRQYAEQNPDALEEGNAFRIWDNTIEHGYYLMMLAMEYELLKRASQDVTAVKNELYYALNAINRIDLEAEFYLSNENAPRSLNGFFLRDDIPPSFLDNFADEGFVYMNTDYSNAVLMEEYAPGSAHPGHTYQLTNGSLDDYNDNGNEASKDQLSGLLMGLRFVAEYVPEGVWVQPTPDDVGFNLLEETRAITQRMLENLRWNYQNYLRPRTDVKCNLCIEARVLGRGHIYMKI